MGCLTVWIRRARRSEHDTSVGLCGVAPIRTDVTKKLGEGNGGLGADEGLSISLRDAARGGPTPDGLLGNGAQQKGARDKVHDGRDKEGGVVGGQAPTRTSRATPWLRGSTRAPLIATGPRGC